MKTYLDEIKEKQAVLLQIQTHLPVGSMFRETPNTMWILVTSEWKLAVYDQLTKCADAEVIIPTSWTRARYNIPLDRWYYYQGRMEVIYP